MKYKNILRDFDAPMATLPRTWYGNRNSWDMTLPIKGTNLVERILTAYEDNSNWATFLRHEDGDVYLRLTFLGEVFTINLLAQDDINVRAEIMGIDMPFLKVKAFKEHLNTLAYRIQNSSVSTTMEEIIKGKLWKCDDMQSIAEALECLGSSKTYEHNMVMHVTDKASLIGYILETSDDPFTGTPLWYVYTKAEYYLLHAEKTAKMQNIMTDLAVDIAKALNKG